MSSSTRKVVYSWATKILKQPNPTRVEIDAYRKHQVNALAVGWLMLAIIKMYDMIIHLMMLFQEQASHESVLRFLVHLGALELENWECSWPIIGHWLNPAKVAGWLKSKDRSYWCSWKGRTQCLLSRSSTWARNVQAHYTSLKSTYKGC